MGSHWMMSTPMPEAAKKLVVLDASHVEEVASQVDFVFCAVNMKKDEIRALEEAYAKAECPVVSTTAHTALLPMCPWLCLRSTPSTLRSSPPSAVVGAPSADSSP